MSSAVDVVVPAWNRWDLTRRCLEHLEQQTLEHTVILADSGSIDGTSAKVRDEFPRVRLVELRANRGFSVACNRGVAVGRGDVVVLLNNDVECRPDFLAHLVAPFSADERIGSVAALLLMPGERRIDSLGLAADRTLAGYPRLRAATLDGVHGTAPVLVGPSGAAGAYRRRAWHDVGGLDEGVRAYSEDLDLALRLRAAGWAAAAAPDAIGMHLGSASARTRSASQRYEGGFSRAYFLRRYGVLRTGAAARAAATELIAAVGDAVVYSHDLAAARGRIAGWRAAAGRPQRPRPPRDAIDAGITFTESLRLRRRVYECT
jgi:N-acetylglucosaminyl-diphospho-decaprenol L-rhamnosyltransferase